MARAKKSKSKLSELEGQPDPRAALDSAGLLSACQGVLARLEADLLERTKASPAVTRALEARYEAEKKAERTAESFAGWTALLATQVAAAWVLSCVFVRTLEDRGLLKQARLAGPGAEDSQRQFFQLAPSLTERDYLLTVFRELAHHPAAKDLFDANHSPVWKLSPSAAAAKELLALFRMPNATTPAFRFGQASTRFLGDLYQDISEDVRKRYALLQTPDFIESFILDRTLEPAIQRFGLDDTTLIDPTCGSGHFLLGAFDRLFEHRLRAEPGVDPRVAAVKALDCAYGADINPYAVAIARFRLTLSFLEKAGYAKLADAPVLPLHLVVADSLRINAQHPQTELWQQEGVSSQGWLGEVFTLEDEEAARGVLFRQYAAVVGNPPYITVKDGALRDAYRAMYPRSCFREYSLAAPFCERFFQLSRPRGYVGQITANSFMKREFGRKLIEEFLPSVNLTQIMNTSGAYVPGHGTPTILLFGTAEPPQTRAIRAVLAKLSEPSVPDDAAQGLVWQSICRHFDNLGFENEFITVSEVSRDVLDRHPWSLGGGGAAELKKLMEERATSRLRDRVHSIGFMCITKQDEAFSHPVEILGRAGIEIDMVRTFVLGEHVRDWSIQSDVEVVFPYEQNGRLRELGAQAHRFLWPYRAVLESRAVFGGQTFTQSGRRWYEYGQIPVDRIAGPCITFPFVATHNHFVFDQGGKVFNRTAPIIKLPKDASDDDHFALLAYLNSSIACFWMKQVFFDKGNQGGERGRPSEPFEAYFEFDSTKLADLPIPGGFDDATGELAAIARSLHSMSLRRLQLMDVSSIFAESASAVLINEGIAARIDLVHEVERALRALQEQLDWTIYRLFGLTTHAPQSFEFRDPGARICDHRWAREALAAHSSVRYFGLCHVGDPSEIASLQWVEKWGLAADEKALLLSDAIRIVETPAYKRTYKDSFGAIDVRLHGMMYLARKLEQGMSTRTEVVTLAELANDLRRREVSALEWCEELNQTMSGELLIDASVPFAAACRYSETGIETFSRWNVQWEKQRAQDLGHDCEIVPAPKYSSDDFSDHRYYRIRGKLDVPSERFISYPGCESDNDGEPVYGWAGWDHLQRAKALASLYLNRKDNEGWTADRLTPMLAGLLELIPWVKQWHNEPSDEFGGLRMGDYYEQFLDGECRLHGLTHDDLRAWRPTKKPRGSGKAAAKARRAKADADADAAKSVEGEAGEEAATPAPKKPRAKKRPVAAKEAPAAEEAE